MGYGRRLGALAVALASVAPVVARAQSELAAFRADRQTVWDQFRHGGGLNDIVTNPNLPARPSWRFAQPRKGTSASPVVAGKLVLVAANDRAVYAVDAADGKPVWQWDGDNEVMSSPVYRDGVAIAGTGDSDSLVWSPPDYAVVGMGRSDLNGIDLRTGKTRWTFALTGTGMPMPALAGDTVLHVDGSGVLVALDARTGAYRWRRLFYSNASMASILLGGNGTAYFGGGFPGAVYAVRSSDGAPVWTHRFARGTGSFDDCPLATDGSRIFGMYSAPLEGAPRALVAAGVHAQQHAYALDSATGKTRWDTALPVSGVVPAYNESAIPMYAGGTVYDGSAIAPIVTALDARTGRVRWTLHVGGPVKGGFVLRDGALYFGDLGGRLWAVDPVTGRVLGSVQTDLRFNVGSPIALNGSLVVGSSEGPVIAVPLDAIRSSQPVAGVTTRPISFSRLWAGALALLAAIAAAVVLYRQRTLQTA